MSLRNLFLVFQRDYLGYVKAWGFWLSLLAVPLFMLAGAGMAVLAKEATPVRYYTVIEKTPVYSVAIDEAFERAETAELEQALEMTGDLLPEETKEALDSVEARDGIRKFFYVPPPEQTIEELRPYLTGERLVRFEGKDVSLFAAFIVSEDGEALEYWSEDVSVSALHQTARRAMTRLARDRAFEQNGLPNGFLDSIDETVMEVKEKRLRESVAATDAASDVTFADRAPTYVVAALAYFLWLMVFSIIQYLLMGTIEERSNKIFDTLLTSLKLPELLGGKLLAVFAVTSTMMLAWGMFAVLVGGVTSSQMGGAGEVLEPILAAALDPKVVLVGLVSFCLGYLLYGVIFMALGSLCDTIQEAQTLLSPMMILLMLPMFAILLAFRDPGSPIVDVATWIPLFTPFLLILRIPQDPPLWEVIAQMALMLVTTLVVMWGATRVYRAGAVHGAGIGDIFKVLKPNSVLN